MAGIKIADMSPDVTVGGGELIPVSDAGVTKSVTTTVLKQYIIDAIEALAAGTTTTGADSAFMLQGGVMKPVDVDVITQFVVDTVFAKAAATVPADADIIPLKQGGTTEKTLTLTLLAEYVRAEIEAAVLDLTSLDSAGALADTDYLLVTQSGVGKKVYFSALVTSVYAGFAAYLTAKTAVVTPADSDFFYVIQGGFEKKVTLAVLKTAFATTYAPATTTENYVPQWASAQKTLKDGLSVVTTLRAAATAADTALATEKAARTAIDVVNSAIATSITATRLTLTKAPASSTENKIPQWDATTLTLKDGLTLRTTQRATASADDISVPTEQAVGEALDLKVTAPASSTTGNVPKWNATSLKLDDGFTTVTYVRTVASSLDTALPTEQAVREAIQTVTETQTNTVSSSGGTAAQIFGATASEGLQTVVAEVSVSLGAVAGVAVFTIPAGAWLRSVQGNITTAAVAGGTSVAVGLGTDADPNLYAATAVLTKNAKTTSYLLPLRVTASTALEAFPIASGGGIGNTQFSAGVIRVRIVFDRETDLDNVV